MRDERLLSLTNMIIDHSLKLQQQERVLIKAHAIAKPLVKTLIQKIYEIGAYPYVELLDDDIAKDLAKGMTKPQLETQAAWEMKKYEDVDAIVAIIGEENDAELSDVPAENFQLRGDVFQPVEQFYTNNRRWVLLNYPTRGLAQKAGMSTETFTNYLLDVCNIDYQKMNEASQPLKQLMEKTDRVRITAPGTDLSFSIKEIPAVICSGEYNIPDGEVYTAPVKDSVNGTITFNTPSPYHGVTFRDVSLTFEDGKLIKAEADKTDDIIDIFDTDEGARYVGEFAIGLNPLITEPMGDILFDEKIAGSIHFTPGEAYEDADNGNRSAIHWDLVLIQRADYGGGALYFDDVLIRQDGEFVLPELEGLNPEKLR